MSFVKYNSQEYVKWRKKIFKRDRFTCQLCGTQGKTLNAHHIKPKALYPELALDKNNGITLCEECHEIVTGNETLFEELFFAINTRKVTKQLIYSFFAKLTCNFTTIVKNFKKTNKWAKLPEMMARHVKRSCRSV